jgi:hypothetical protein
MGPFNASLMKNGFYSAIATCLQCTNNPLLNIRNNDPSFTGKKNKPVNKFYQIYNIFKGFCKFIFNIVLASSLISASKQAQGALYKVVAGPSSVNC